MDTAQPLAGKVAVITGSARNMGRAFAVALARLGANVTLHYHTQTAQSDIEETACLVQGAGSQSGYRRRRPR